MKNTLHGVSVHRQKNGKVEKNMVSKCLVLTSMCLALLLGVAVTAQCVSINLTADPDSFPAGTNISNAFPGITLASIGPGFDGNYDPRIFSRNPLSYLPAYHASTGNLVFGTDDTSFPHVFGGWGDASFRVTFAFPANQVILDAIGNNSSDFGRLQAFTSSGTLISSYYTGQLTVSSFEAMSVTSLSYSIAYVIASGVSGDSVGFDNLRASVVPEPSSVLALLCGIGGLGGLLHRRRI